MAGTVPRVNGDIRWTPHLHETVAAGIPFHEEGTEAQRERSEVTQLLSGSQYDLDSGLADPTGQDFNLYFVSSSSLTQHFLKTIK